LKSVMEKINAELDSKREKFTEQGFINPDTGGLYDFARLSSFKIDRQQVEMFDNLGQLNTLLTQWQGEMPNQILNHIESTGGFNMLGEIQESLTITAQEAALGQVDAENDVRQANMEAQTLVAEVRAALLTETGLSEEDVDAMLDKSGRTISERAQAVGQYGRNPVTGLPLDADGNDLIPPKILNPHTGAEEDATYDPNTHAWLNHHALQNLLTENESDMGVLWSNYGYLNLKPGQIPELAGEIDPNDPRLKVLVPVDETSLLHENPEIIVHNGRIITTGNQNEVLGPQNGPLTDAELIPHVISHQMAEQMGINPEAFDTGGQRSPATAIKMPTQSGEGMEAQPAETLEQTGQVKRVSPPQEPGRFERGGSAAQFLARLRGMPEEVQRRTTVGQQFSNLLRDQLTAPLGIMTIGLGGLVPRSQLNRFWENVDQEAKLQQERQQLEQRVKQEMDEAIHPSDRLASSEISEDLTERQVREGFMNIANQRKQQGQPPLTQEEATQMFSTVFQGKRGDVPTQPMPDTGPIQPPLPGTEPPTPTEVPSHVQSFMNWTKDPSSGLPSEQDVNRQMRGTTG